VQGLAKWIGIGVTALLLVTIGFITAAAFVPEFRVISRDIAIVILAVFQMIASLLVVLLLVVLLYTLKTLNQLTQESLIPQLEETRHKLDEVLANLQAITQSIRESADTASTTTVFVAERVASPIIRASSVVAGVRAAASSLAHRDSKEEKSV
jgi:ABC-type maltose transport system permease subunit